MISSQDPASPVKSPYPFNAPGKPVFLFTGPLEVNGKGTNNASGPGQIILEMVPSPHVVWKMSCSTGTGLGERTLILPDFSGVFPISQQEYADLRPEPLYLEDSLTDSTPIGDSTSVTSLRFHLINCPLYPGQATLRSTTLIWTGRFSLFTQDWTIDIDARPDYQDAWRTTVKHRSFVFTHVVSIRRKDGSAFDFADTTPIRDALYWFLSFVRGGLVGQALVVGTDSQGGEIFVRWGSQQTVHPGQTQVNWYPRFEPRIVSELFESFWAKWEHLQDQELQDTAKWLIGAYASANTGLETDSGIMATCAALEALTWIVLVRQEEWLTEDGYERLNAADRLLLLLRWAKIPSDSLPRVPEFQKMVKEFRRNGPQTLTWVRNRIVHPDKKQQLKGEGIKVASYSLGLWYLELVLLRLFDYQDVYCNRLSRQFVGEVEPVPWAETDQ